MSERDPSRPHVAGTLLGVPAPRIEDNTDSPARKPVFVRSGTSVADDNGAPPPVPRMALPSRPQLAENERLTAPLSSAASSGRVTGWAWVTALLKLPVRLLGGELTLAMVVGPLLLVFLLLVLLVSLGSAGTQSVAARPQPSSPAVPSAAPSSAGGARAALAGEKSRPSLLAELEGRSPESLESRELIQVAEARAERQREVAKALRQKVEAQPASISDKGLQAQLLQLVADVETARDALSTMAAVDAPVGPDLLYEVWTGTAARTDATELARALVYSKDVRPKASPALSVALELRAAESCEQYEAVLPKALKDGDRRVLHLLTKLNAKKGCGPKKNEDCYACLRDQGDELTATINAVKSRRPPSYPAH